MFSEFLERDEVDYALGNITLYSIFITKEAIPERAILLRRGGELNAITQNYWLEEVNNHLALSVVDKTNRG